MDPSQGLPPGYSRETSIRRDARGRWFNGDDPIDHPQLVEAFDRWLDRAEDGRYILWNDINWAYVQVDGPPVFVRGVTVSAGGDVHLRLSGATEEVLEPGTLRQDPQGVLYCDVRGGRLPACFDRYAMSALAEQLGGEDDQGAYLQIGGVRYHPPVVHESSSSR